MVAIMNEALELAPGLKVLEVGAGSGWHAATVAEVVAPSDAPKETWGHVWTIEIVPELALMARKNIEANGFADRVTVFDSRSLSIGQGLQAVRAARMALQNKSMDRILETLGSLRERTRIFIELDTLEFVRRGGRADKLMPAIDRLARVLHVKPLLTIVDGELKLVGVARSYKKGLRRIKEDMLRLGPLEALGVMHIRCQEMGAQMADDLAKLTGISRDQIPLREAGTVLSCQGGKGVVAAMGLLRSGQS